MLTAEAFFDGASQTGVLLRDERPGVLATLVCFALEGAGVYRAEQVTETGDGPTEWRRFRFTESLSGVVTEGERTSEGVSVSGVVLDGDAVPSYLGHRILVDLARRGGDRAAFRQLDEHGDPEVHDVEVVHRGAEEVSLPGDGSSLQAERYELVLDGEPYTSFWWDGRSVVASDWTAGAMSVLAADLETALEECPEPVAEIARAWVASHPV